jgi:hypothetical protein
MRPAHFLAAALLGAGALLAATPGQARVELPQGQPGGAESGGRSIPGAARHARPGCVPAGFLPFLGFGWWMPFPAMGCLGLQQMEGQTRLEAGARAALMDARTPPRAPRLVPPRPVRRDGGEKLPELRRDWP